MQYFRIDFRINTEGKRHLPLTAGYSHANTMQRATSFLQYKDTLLTDGHLVVHHDSQGLSSEAGFQLIICQVYLCPGLFHLTWRTLPGHVWLLTEPAFFQATKTLLKSSPAHYHLLRAQQICSAPHHSVHYDQITQNHPKNWPPKDMTSKQLSDGLCPINPSETRMTCPNEKRSNYGSAPACDWWEHTVALA